MLASIRFALGGRRSRPAPAWQVSGTTALPLAHPPVFIVFPVHHYLLNMAYGKHGVGSRGRHPCPPAALSTRQRWWTGVLVARGVLRPPNCVPSVVLRAPQCDPVPLPGHAQRLSPPPRP